MNIDDINFTKHLKNLSSRHHYIPKFLIEEFTNDEGLLFIYDKQKDEILKKQKPPKSIFYEFNRNTVDINATTQSSVIEDLLYTEIDNKTSKAIKYFQTEELSKIDFTLENTGFVLFFLITLFWRIPKTDYAADDIINRAEITNPSIDPEVLRIDPTFRKLSRTGLFGHTMEQMKNFGRKGKKWSNIHRNANSIYVIGDYPFLFKEHPNTFKGFNDSDILFAVSSKRIFSSTNEALNSFPIINSYSYNALIINQSIKYVACGDLKTLQQSINFYKQLKAKGLIYFTDRAFMTNETTANKASL